MTSSRFIPTLERVRESAQTLPPAAEFPDETIDVPLSNGRVLQYRKLKIKLHEGKIYRWVYEGKVIVG